MRFATTTHAIERWAEVTDPPLDYRVARAELEDVALRGLGVKVGTTRRGQAVYRVDEPRLAFLVVKLGPDKLKRGYDNGMAAGVIVTVLPAHLWERDEVDEAAELQEAWAELQARGSATACPDLAPALPPLDLTGQLGEQYSDWRSWAWATAQIERERRAAEHLRNEREQIHSTRAIVEAVFGLLAGRMDRFALERLEAAVEAAFPGRLAAARQKSEQRERRIDAAT